MSYDLDLSVRNTSTVSASKHTWLTEIHSLLTSGIALLELNCFPKFRLSYPPPIHGAFKCTWGIEWRYKFYSTPVYIATNKAHRLRRSVFVASYIIIIIVSQSVQPEPPAFAIVRQNGRSSASCRASVAVTPVSRQIWRIVWLYTYTLFVLGTDDIHFLTSISSLSLILILIFMMWE